jgi:ATP-dependent Zn protease
VGDRIEVTAETTATAYHEAGHAVVALALGRPVHKVSIRPKADWLGRCEFRKGIVRPSDDWLEDEILIALGGMAAEAQHTGTYDRDAAGRDLRYVRRLALNRVSERSLERFERRMLAKTENLLADAGHWAAVELIAAELLKSGEISGRAARYFFDRGQTATFVS